MIYLFNNQVGHDPNSIGFPSVKGCNAIVYQTTQALYGFHNLGGYWENQRVNKADAFARYIQSRNIPHTDHATNLYSAVVGNERYDQTIKKQRAEWAAEMVAIADALGYDGPITLISIQNHVGGDSAYIQYDAKDLGAGCDIGYKKWSKMDHQMGEEKPKGLKEIGRDTDRVKEEGVPVFHYVVNKPSEVVTDVRFKKGGGVLRPVVGNSLVRTITRQDGKKDGGCILL